MSTELAALAAESMPFVAAAVSAYGGAVLAKAKDEVADATVGWGRKLLQRIFGHKREGEALPVVLAEVIDHRGDQDYLDALRLAIRKALETDAALARDVGAILAEARPNVTGNQDAQADRGGVAQNVTAGRDAFAVARGDMTIHRTAD
ncbi:MAG TPA: hypothetical protein VHZ03_54295 [Trebonia sp.]|jgi:hypothetical protein|nr:hypothetical protein [Trebonia sp.]